MTSSPESNVTGPSVTAVARGVAALGAGAGVESTAAAAPTAAASAGARARAGGGGTSVVRRGRVGHRAWVGATARRRRARACGGRARDDGWDGPRPRGTVNADARETRRRANAPTRAATREDATMGRWDDLTTRAMRDARGGGLGVGGGGRGRRGGALGGVRFGAAGETARGFERGVRDGARFVVAPRAGLETGVRALGDEVFGAGGDDGVGDAGGAEGERALGAASELDAGEGVDVVGVVRGRRGVHR